MDNFVGYDGPYSSKNKIYILAASGVAAAVIAPAAAIAGATGSATGPAVTAVVGGSALATAANQYQKHYKNLPDDYKRETESKIIETDFYKLYAKKSDNHSL